MVLGFLKRPTGVIALGIIIVIGIIGLIGPSIAAQNPLDPHTPESFLPQEPSEIHPFGTDFEDKDLLSQFLWGAGSTVGFALLVLIFSAALGIFIGFVFASLGKIIDGIFVIIANFFIAVSFFLPLTLITISGRSLSSSVLVCSMLAWAPIAFVIRNEIKMLRSEKGTDSGWSLSEIFHNPGPIIKRIAPKMLFAIKISFVIGFFSFILLDIFGLGDPNAITWGWILQRALENSAMVNLWWWCIIPPVIGIILIAVSMYFILDSLEMVAENEAIREGLVQEQKEGKEIPQLTLEPTATEKS